MPRRTVIVGVSFSVELLAEIDKLRERVPRSRWICDVCRAAVRASREASD